MPDAISPARSQDRAIGQIPPANPKVPAKAPVCIILHQENSNPGHVGQWFVRNGHSLDIRKPRFGDPLPPTLEHHCGCVIFGGPMSANDKDAFVRSEIDWIGVPLRERKPFLGICLGAQMLTVNLGAKVGFHPEEFVEIGYYPLLATEPGGDALGQLPDHVYEWHKEGFELASGARLLATNPDNWCPVSSERTRPGAGATAAFLEASTGRRAYYLGKPNGYMFHRARRKLAELTLNEPGQVVMIGDTMETDIRGAIEAGMQAFLVLSGSTLLENVGDYVYQPTRVLTSVADLLEEVRTGKASDRLNSPVFTRTEMHGNKAGHRHQTDVFALHKPRPRPAMTK